MNKFLIFKLLTVVFLGMQYVGVQATMTDTLGVLTKHVSEVFGVDAKVIELNYNESGEVIAAVRAKGGSVNYITCRSVVDASAVECYSREHGRRVYQVGGN